LGESKSRNGGEKKAREIRTGKSKLNLREKKKKLSKGLQTRKNGSKEATKKGQRKVFQKTLRDCGMEGRRKVKKRREKTLASTTVQSDL